MNGDTAVTHKQLVLGGGCFWCIEAIFQSFKGVEKVESGYAGGHVINPTYEQISGKKTGHAEVVRVTYNPAVITLGELVEIFFHLHDPTTPNRQGADIGPQYRSIIFFADDAEKKSILEVKQKVEDSKLWSAPIITEVVAAAPFYMAEAYHQNYYRNNSSQPYCSFVIAPKMQKLYKLYKGRLKEGA